MPRYIDADGVKKCAVHAQIYTKHLNDDGSVTYEMHVADAVTVKDIENAPTVDAVEVVRCKDCRDYSPESVVTPAYCRAYGAQKEEDDFCSWGERKKENAAD